MNRPHTFSAGTTGFHAFFLLPDIPSSEEEDITVQWSLAAGNTRHRGVDSIEAFPWGQGASGMLMTIPGSQFEDRCVSTFAPTIREATH